MSVRISTTLLVPSSLKTLTSCNTQKGQAQMKQLCIYKKKKKRQDKTQVKTLVFQHMDKWSLGLHRCRSRAMGLPFLPSLRKDRESHRHRQHTAKPPAWLRESQNSLKHCSGFRLDSSHLYKCNKCLSWPSFSPKLWSPLSVYSQSPKGLQLLFSRHPS